MPPFPGEETLATVFVDAHTYFGPPSPRPILHRFDKDCYLYIYYNSTRHTSRLEVAVNPSTADQTSFNGFLDIVSISNSDRFPSRLTLVVGGHDHAASSPASAKARDPDEWRLASADPRDSGTTKYRIHTIDFYFWVSEDAKLILDFMSRLLDPHQLDIPQTRAHHDEDEHLVSSVVQNLENVAISDPAYHEPKQSNSPGPPPKEPPQPQPPQASGLAANQQTSLAATSPTSSSAGVGAVPINKSPTSDQSYAPLAYNPAAPAAPEPTAHREDTPPPVDGAGGTGLAAAVHDNPYAHQQRQQYQQHPQQSYGFPPAPSAGQYGSLPTPSFGPHATSPPPAASFGPQSQPSFGPHAVSPPPQASPRTSLAAQTYTPGGQDPNAHIFGQQQAVQTPGTQFYQSINNQQTHKPLAHVQPQYPDYLSSGGHARSRPPSGYSNYQYAQQAPLPQPGQQQQPPPPTAGNPYDVHNQFYQPTELEHRNSHHYSSSSSRPHRNSSTSQHQQHKPSNTEKIEKGVGKFFRKIEKKIG
ncbi:hypothetical protein PV10_02454 [Exophiala mesophila]|uniref:RNA recognition motif-containing protein n=1 Tax=Exophiala mesophila TaxID=212818 RepID=A0A0D1Y2B0_EXOME|nr:uncharacterized protein PV10_02454 [Exophiala mesophila]KIV94716.1 hypothetical protein PV10_02454 [Exophiala mesophila]